MAVLGTGRMGRALAGRLLDGGHEVVVYDNLSKGYSEAVPQDARLVRGEIADRAALDALFRDTRPEAVLHFAALIEAGESMKVPERYFRNNSDEPPQSPLAADGRMARHGR